MKNEMSTIADGGVRGKAKSSIHDHMLESGFVVIIKGKLPCHHGKEGDPSTPDIRGCSNFLGTLENFGSAVEEGPSAGLELAALLLACLQVIAKAKVAELDLPSVEEDVIELDIPVGEPIAVEVVEDINQLPEDGLGLHLGEETLRAINHEVI